MAEPKLQASNWQADNGMEQLHHNKEANDLKNPCGTLPLKYDSE